MKRPNDTIGKVAGYTVICVVVAVMAGGVALVQAQDAIDEAVAQQQALACYQHARMCAAVQADRK